MQVFIDDTDPTIKYSGMEVGPLDVLPAQSFFNNTFHHLSAPGSETSVGAGLSFTFSGTEFVIGGTVFRKDSQPFSPQCVIDGAISPPPQYSDHVGVLCQGQKLSNGKHTIAVTVAGSNSQSQLWIDFIHYMPSAMISDGGSLFTPPPNPMTLGPDWSSNQGDMTSFLGVQTNVNGAEINFNATGRSIALLGCSSDNLPQLPPAKVVYTIDGNATETITNNTLILFETNLNYGNHQISVKYEGSSGEMPLTFCGSVSTDDQSNQLNGVSATSISNSHSATSNTMRPTSTKASDTSMPKPHIDAGPIMGAVIGGIALGALVVLAVLLLRKYRRRQQAPPDYSDFERAINVAPASAPPQMPAPARVLSTWRRTLAFSDKQRPPVPPRRSSMSKSIYSVRSFTSYHPSPQTAQVGSEYGGSPPSSPRLRSSAWFGSRNYGKFSSTEPILL